MSNYLELAEKQFLAQNNITERELEKVLGNILGGAIDAGDLYFQSMRHESFSLEDGIIKEGGYSIDKGVGIRAMSGEKTGFAYSDEILLPALEQAAVAAKSIARSQKNQSVQVWKKNALTSMYHPYYTDENPIESISATQKIQLLKEVDAYARQLSPYVCQVMVSLGGSYETVLVMATDGTYSADIRPMVRLNVSVVVEKNGRRETAGYGGGGRKTYQQFIDENLGIEFAKEAVRQALVNLEAVPAPAGAMPVVLGPGWPGVLLHEAVGHGLEGDFNRKGSSAFTGRIGELVASPLCTVVDDGTLQNRRGSLTVDDEGVPTERTVLIENGILKGYMQDKLNAKLMGTKSTGNGRRQSYAHVPMPRMTNTFMLPGKHAPEEIIQSVSKGIYAVNFGGGSVDITSGKFVFSASEAYLIENGKVTRPVKGATLIGNGPDVMTKISMVGNDLKLDNGVGTCGKEGQTVPVGVGQPTLLVDEIIVGGTEN